VRSAPPHRRFHELTFVKEITMQLYFPGRPLGAEAFTSEPAPLQLQSPLAVGATIDVATAARIGIAADALNPQPLPPKEIGAALLDFGSVLDPVALNPQPLPPKEIGAALLDFGNVVDPVALNPQPLPPKSINEDLLAKLPRSLLDTVALNPQPLPPKESGQSQTLFASMPKTPFQALALGSDIRGSLQPSLAGGAAEMQRHDPKKEIVRPVGEGIAGSIAREYVSLKNLVDDGVAQGGRWKARDRVMPFGPSDFIGGIGSQPIQGDRMRAPLFVKGGSDADEVSMNDIYQQNIGDCYFLGSLAAVARHDPQRIKDMVVDHGDGTYTVTFKERVPYTEPPQFIDKPITVTGDFPGGLNGNGHAAGADVTKQATVEIWPLVFEKAFGQYVNEKDPYGALDLGGSSQFALEAITGRAVKADGEWDLSKMGVSGQIYLGPPAKDFDELLSDFQAGKAITVCTSKLEQELVPSHCYAVDKVYRDANGKQWVVLYNPWGATDSPPPIPFELLQNDRMYTA
jgi:hypothetical protein